jgi:hypothetical protein
MNLAAIQGGASANTRAWENEGCGNMNLAAIQGGASAPTLLHTTPAPTRAWEDEGFIVCGWVCPGNGQEEGSM